MNGDSGARVGAAESDHIRWPVEMFERPSAISTEGSIDRPSTGTTPLVSVCIVTYQGVQWIESCLGSVLAQTHDWVEIIVVDNGSSDDTARLVAALQAGAPDLVLVRLDRNVGYAAAHNLALRHTHGEFVCLLNQDVVLDEGFLAAAATQLVARPEVAAIQGLILRLGQGDRPTDVIDTTGLVMHRDRRILSRDQGKHRAAAAAQPGYVFGPDGPAPVYRTAALEDAQVDSGSGRNEVLDESFFLYHEDTDLAWRLALLGWATWYEPSARAWHARGSAGPRASGPVALARYAFAMPETARMLAWRNQRLSILKNDVPAHYLRDLPFIAFREVGAAVLLFGTNPRRASALLSLFRMIPMALAKRRAIQRRRRQRSGSHPSLTPRR